MKARYLITVGLLVFVGFLVAFAPAAIAPRFAHFPAALTYSALEGTLWNITVKDAYWRSRAVGNVRFSINPLSVFSGAAKGQFVLQKTGLNGSGVVSLADTLLLEDFEFYAQLHTSVGAMPVSGAVTIAGQQVEWDSRGQCVGAKANITTDIPAIMFADFRDTIADTVAGFSCANGRLLASFTQDVGVGRLSGTGTFIKADVLNLELVLRFSDQAAIPDTSAVFMRQLGFKLKQDGWYSEVTLRL